MPRPDLLLDLVAALRRQHGVVDDLAPDHGGVPKHGGASDCGQSVGAGEEGGGWARTGGAERGEVDGLGLAVRRGGWWMR